MDTYDENIEKAIWDWWKRRRKKYNLGLVIAGITAFILYVILGVTLIMPYDNEFEITLFTIAFQAFGYFIYDAYCKLVILCWLCGRYKI